jgi:hypothetical protein
VAANVVAPTETQPDPKAISASTDLQGSPVPMFDVHSPRTAAHTWTDFWIHLGTIAIGLLIAIGLEQSVEALHRLHERHRLEQDLQMEAKKNLILMDIDNQHFDAMLAWLIQLRGQVDAMRASGGKANFTYQPPPKTRGVWSPDSPYWNTAKESAEIGLLPRDAAGMYDVVYAQQEFVKEVVLAYLNELDQLRRFESRFAVIESKASASELAHMTPADQSRVADNIADVRPVPDVSRMTPQDLGEYSVLLNNTLTELFRFHRTTNIAYGVTRAITQGARSDEDLFRMMGARPGAQVAPPPAASAAH